MEYHISRLSNDDAAVMVILSREDAGDILAELRNVGDNSPHAAQQAWRIFQQVRDNDRVARVRKYVGPWPDQPGPRTDRQ